MNPKEQKRTSKFISLVLRHKPEVIGLTLDHNGWAEVQELLKKMHDHGRPLTFEGLELIVDNNDKRRFAFSTDKTRIRANQGHSIHVDLALIETTPPEILFHGTADSNLPAIRLQGLLKGRRHHVHLSPDPVTARKVGQRHGKPVVLIIRSGEMHQQGITFYESENGVWLTDYVPAGHIEFPF